ncbi:MAG: hypothetical protein Q9170_005285 [Blastenia crenularia]
MERGDVLPRGRGTPRQRRLGLEAREMSTLSTSPAESNSIEITDQLPATDSPGGPVLRDQTKASRASVPQARDNGIRPGYMFREANWQIGRAEPKGKKKEVRLFKKTDRFRAWRERTAQRVVDAEKRTLRGRGKKRTGGR